MKDIEQIIDQYRIYPPSLTNADCDLYDRDQIRAMLTEYANEVLNEILENPESYINDVDTCDIPYGVIDKKAVEKLKNSIQ